MSTQRWSNQIATVRRSTRALVAHVYAAGAAGAHAHGTLAGSGGIERVFIADPRIPFQGTICWSKKTGSMKHVMTTFGTKETGPLHPTPCKAPSLKKALYQHLQQVTN